MSKASRLMALPLAVALTLAGCDGSVDTTRSPSTSAPTSATPTSPDASTTSVPPTPTPTPAPTPTPDAAAIAAMAADTWNLARATDLPPDGNPPADLVTQVEAATAPDSDARTAFLNHLDSSFGPDLALRGDVVAEPLGRPETDGSSITIPLCISESVTNTATGPDTIDIDITDTYSRLVATVVERDGTWVLSGWSGDNDGTRLDPCVPPSQRDAITTSWNNFIDAQAAWRLDTSDQQARQDFRRWVATKDTVALNPEPRRIVLDRTHVALDIQEVGRSTATLWWCQDPSLNPSSGVLDGDGNATPLPRLVYGTEWMSDDDVWKLSTLNSYAEQSRDGLDGQWERCFVD